MGRFKELMDKQKAGTLTEEETVELKDLQADFKAQDAEENEEKAVEELSEKLAQGIQKQVNDAIAPINKAVEALSNAQKEQIEVTKSTSGFVVDSQMGQVSVKQLEEATVEIEDRKRMGKKFTTTSKKTIHMLQALVQNDRQKLQILTEGTAANGGYLVPEEFANMIVEDRRDATIMRQLATVIPVSTDTFHLPTLASRPKTFWRSEAAVKNTSTAQFGEIVLTPYSLASIVPLSNELVADASLGTGGSIVNLIANLMGTAIAEEEDKAFWTGNGSGKPTGIDNYSFVTLTASANDASRADTIIQALYRLPQGYRNSAVVVANKNTLAKIAVLKDTTGQYLLTGLANSPTPVLRGRPIYEQNDLPDGKAFVGDFRDYYIAERQGVTVDVSNEATVGGTSAFENNLTYVRVEERVDGELALTNGIVEVQGLGTV
jgi:HK97 family phage major capsid protein